MNEFYGIICYENLISPFITNKEVQSQCKETKCVFNIYFPNLHNLTLKDAFLVDIN